MFEGPEDHHARIGDPAPGIDGKTAPVIRNCGPVGYPGSAEVVNMQPPAAPLRHGVTALPATGDGRQSGTSGPPSILDVSSKAAVGGGLALLKDGDPIRIGLATRKVEALIPAGELAARRAAWTAPADRTPWKGIHRAMVGSLGTGGCLEPATPFLDILETRGESRHNL